MLTKNDLIKIIDIARTRLNKVDAVQYTCFEDCLDHRIKRKKYLRILDSAYKHYYDLSQAHAEKTVYNADLLYWYNNLKNKDNSTYLM